MSFQGVLLLDILGLILLLWVLSLIRHGRLYVGYGVILVTAIILVSLMISIPRLLIFITQLVGAEYPTSALSLLALGFFTFMLVYILTQITMLSNRLTRLIQRLAIEGATKEIKSATNSDDLCQKK